MAAKEDSRLGSRLESQSDHHLRQSRLREDCCILRRTGRQLGISDLVAQHEPCRNWTRRSWRAIITNSRPADRAPFLRFAFIRVPLSLSACILLDALSISSAYSV